MRFAVVLPSGGAYPGTIRAKFMAKLPQLRSEMDIPDPCHSLVEPRHHSVERKARVLLDRETGEPGLCLRRSSFLASPRDFGERGSHQPFFPSWPSLY